MTQPAIGMSPAQSPAQSPAEGHVEGHAHVYAIATMDTKGEELRFLVDRLRGGGVSVRSVDVGTLAPATHPADVSRMEIMRGGDVSGDDRSTAVTATGEELRNYLVERHSVGEVAGVIGIGGSGGTALITAAMRGLPIGLPKLMVSTVASGNIAPYIDCTDILMMNSVVDIAGLNTVSESILSNAAHAMVGMVKHAGPVRRSRPAVGMTMFGVTTPCVTAVRQALEAAGYDCLVFHATGSGGRAMERLVESGFLGGILDITTTEVADEIVGGVFPAGPERLDRLVASGVPLVVSLGAVDMVNFGAIETVPSRFAARKFHAHNAQVTLMRTTESENRQIARWIAGKLNRSTAAVTILVPELGVSAIDAPGQPFYDAEADKALFDELESAIDQTPLRRIVRLPYHINDPRFAAALVSHFKSLCT